MKRILAILVAVALIGGAYYLRTEIIQPAPADGPTPDGTTAATQPPQPGVSLLVTCAEDLEAACAALRSVDGVTVTVEAAGDTADALVEVAGAEAPFDVWVTGAPWPGLVDALRQTQARQLLFPAPAQVAATTTLGVVLTQRAAEACGEVVDFACLSEESLRVGLRDPVTTVQGLAALGQAASGFLGRADYATNDLRLPAFGAWLQGLADRERIRDEPLEYLVLTGGADIDVAITTQVDYDRVSGMGREIPAILYADPGASVEIVVAGTGEAEVSGLQTVVVDTLVEQGWTAGPATDDGLPGAGVLASLREEWRTVAS